MSPQVLPVLCIVGSVQLARQLTQLFAAPSFYFAIMEEPWVDRPDATNEVIRRTNLLALHRHELVIVAGCSDKTINMLSVHFPETYLPKVITIQDISELEQYAGRLRKYLRSTKLERQYVTPGDLHEMSPDAKLAVIEKSGTIGQVIAENLCLAENYRIMLIDEASSESVDGIEDLLREWNLAESATHREESRLHLFQLLRERIHYLSDYRFRRIVFFTRGIPYGVLPFHCPVSHFLQERDLGLQILGAYHRLAEGDAGLAVAVICDPGGLSYSEAIDIEDVLKARKIETITLRDREAEVFRFNHIVQRYPFDVLTISAHAGELAGKRVTARFQSSMGSSHVFVSDRYSTFGIIPDNIDDVMLYETVVPVSMDGVPWHNKEAIGRHLKKIRFDWDEYQRYSRNRLRNEEILKVEDVKGVKYSSAIGLNGMPWMPQVQVVGEGRFPVVFNNACSSWIHMASMFLFAGASAYIGTTRDIVNMLAYECGKEFFLRSLDGTPLSEALYLAQKDSISQADYSPYLYWGHPDINLIPPKAESCRALRDDRVQATLLHLSKKLKNAKDTHMQKDLIETIKIISRLK